LVVQWLAEPEIAFQLMTLIKNKEDQCHLLVVQTSMKTSKCSLKMSMKTFSIGNLIFLRTKATLENLEKKLYTRLKKKSKRRITQELTIKTVCQEPLHLVIIKRKNHSVLSSSLYLATKFSWL